MKFLLHTGLVALLVLASPAGWALLDNFLEEHPYRIRMGNKKLAGDLKDQLDEQRKGSAEYKALESSQRIMQFDRKILLDLLKAEGYYEARVETASSEDELVYTIDAGRPYTIRSVTIRFPDGVNPPAKNLLPVREKQHLRARAVLDSVRLLENHITRNHCLYNVAVRYEARVNRSDADVALVFILTDSPQVTFAEPRLTGLENIKDEHIYRYFEFSAGDCFKRGAIEQTRLALLQSNLIASSDVTIARPKDGEVQTTFQLTERRHRTFRAGLGYEGDLGASVMLGWQHRNMFKSGRRLDVATTFGEQRKGVLVELTAPHFRRREQTLTLYADIAQEEQEAYESTYGEFGANLNRPIRRHWSGTVGTVIQFSRVLDGGEEEDFALLSFPVSLDYNRTNDLLDPRYGWSVNLKTQPFVDLYETSRRFLKTTLVGAVYLTESDWKWQPTLALRAATGTLSDVTLNDVPKDHRYYVGGGGSVRGYAYQSIGALDENNVPQGGLSFSETSAEIRLRLSESWGAVVFADGGYAYTDELPEFGRDFLWGAGVGVRYFTSFAPFRLDIATPLTERRDATGSLIDNKVELYISIGQAF